LQRLFDPGQEVGPDASLRRIRLPEPFLKLSSFEAQRLLDFSRAGPLGDAEETERPVARHHVILSLIEPSVSPRIQSMPPDPAL
jgi:hypothetical protein